MCLHLVQTPDACGDSSRDITHRGALSSSRVLKFSDAMCKCRISYRKFVSNRCIRSILRCSETAFVKRTQVHEWPPQLRILATRATCEAFRKMVVNSKCSGHWFRYSNCCMALMPHKYSFLLSNPLVPLSSPNASTPTSMLTPVPTLNPPSTSP